MLTVQQLRSVARARLGDARALLAARRYDSAIYLAGCAVEVALKARICRTLRWADFPSSKKEFEGLTSLKTHSLDLLLRLSGVEARIKQRYLKEWSIVKKWDPEMRYHPTGKAAHADAEEMLEATSTLLRTL
jgi:HEPN domain-containing protein